MSVCFDLVTQKHITMSSERNKALRALGMKSSKFTEDDIKSCFRACLTRPHNSLSELCRSAFVLFKEVKTFIAAPIWQEVFEKCLGNATFSNEWIELLLVGFDSITHKCFFDQLKHKFKGDYMINKDNIAFTVKDISVPYDRKKNTFGDIVIKGETNSKRKMTIRVSGQGAMIFVSFYFKQILMAFWKRCQISSVEQVYLSPHSSESGKSEQMNTDVNNSSDGADSSDSSDNSDSSELPDISALNESAEILDVTPNVSCGDEEEDGKSQEEEVDLDLLGGDSPIIKTKRRQIREENESASGAQSPGLRSPERKGNVFKLLKECIRLLKCYLFQVLI